MWVNRQEWDRKTQEISSACEKISLLEQENSKLSAKIRDFKKISSENADLKQKNFDLTTEIYHLRHDPRDLAPEELQIGLLERIASANQMQFMGSTDNSVFVLRKNPDSPMPGDGVYW